MSATAAAIRAVSLRRLGVAALVLGLVQGLGGIVRDCALTCHVGYRFAPIAFLVVAMLSLPVIALQVNMQQRWGAEAWRVRSTFLIAASLIVFRVVLALLRPADGVVGFASRSTYLTFFVWVDVAFMVMSAQLFSLLQGDESATDRGLVVFAGAMYLGGLLGGLAASGANSWLQGYLHLPFDVARDHLMLPMALVLVLLIPIAKTDHGVAPPAPHAPDAADGAASPVKTSGLATTLRVLTGDADARSLTTALALASAASISLESLFYWVLTEQTHGGGGFVRLLASMAVWMNGASLVLAVGGASQIIRRLGLGAAVLTVPASLLLGTGFLLVSTVLMVMLVMRVLKDSLSGGLYEPASERLLVRLRGERYGEQRPIFDVASRGGTGVGALLVLVLTLGLHVSVREMAVLVTLLHGGWLVSLVPLVRKARAPVAV